MHSLDSIMTIIFALVAIIVIWKLRSVLGERTGSEKPPGMFGTRQPSNRPSTSGDNVVRLPGKVPPRPAMPEVDRDRWRGIAELGSAAARGLDAIAAADPSFSGQPFLAGARTAYETIVAAFASGDRATLQTLLAPDVFDSFAKALTDRAKRGETVTTTLVSMDEAKIEDASLAGRTARITVRFLAKLITATHDAAGTLVDGNPEQVVEMNDIWSFTRDTAARDPNWKLVATETGH